MRTGFYLQVRVDIVRISVRLRRIHVALLRQHGLHGPVELVLVHYDAGVRFLLLQTHVVTSGATRGEQLGDGALCALRSAPD